MPDTTSRTDELAALRSRLNEYAPTVRKKDEALWRELQQWIIQSGDSREQALGRFVEGQLQELTKSHAMYDHRGVDNPEDAFPDACEGCDHYGVRCPVMKQWQVTQTRERLLDMDLGDDELYSRYSSMASNHDCHVLSGLLSRWQNTSKFLQSGYQLKAQAEALIHDIDLDEGFASAGDLDSLDHDAGDDGDGTSGVTGDLVLGDDDMPAESRARTSNVLESVIGDGDDEEADA